MTTGGTTDGALQALAPGVDLLPLRTPTLPPATHTNTLLVGRGRFVVIEPASPHPDEQARLCAAVEARLASGGELLAVLLTHHHVDHTGYAAGLTAKFRAPLWAHAETAARIEPAVDRQLGDDDIIPLGDGMAIRPIFTPGHAPGHLVYLETSTGIAHGGDMVAGEGTILIDPDDAGDMGAYLESLRMLKSQPILRLVPAHGPVQDAPADLFERYIQHRLGREAKVVAAMGTAPIEHDDLLAGAYADTPQWLWPLASRSLEAHLRKLEADGRVRRDGALSTLLVQA